MTIVHRLYRCQIYRYEYTTVVITITITIPPHTPHTLRTPSSGLVVVVVMMVVVVDLVGVVVVGNRAQSASFLFLRSACCVN